MKISACLLHYKRPDKALITAMSLLHQTLRPVEFVVYDNGGSPFFSSGELFEHFQAACYDFGVPLIYSSGHPLTMAEGRAEVAKLSSSEYVFLGDDDVVYPPDYLERMRDRQQKTGAALLGSRFRLLRGSGALNSERYLKSGQFKPLPFDGGTMLLHWSLFPELREVAALTADIGEDIIFQMLAHAKGARLAAVLPPDPDPSQESSWLGMPYHMRARDVGRYSVGPAVLDKFANERFGTDYATVEAAMLEAHTP